MLTVQDFLHSNWTGVSSVYGAFIILYWNKDAFAVKHRQKFADHTIYLPLEVGVKMGQIRILMHLSFVLLGDEFLIKGWVGWRIEVRL